MEFEGLVDSDGKISVPERLLDLLHAGKETRVHVRLSTVRMSTSLRRKNVTEEEIERISGLQLEPRSQVVKFLLSEGVLKKHSRWLVHRVGK